MRQAWKNLLVTQHHDIQITGLVAEARRFLGQSRAASGDVTRSSLRQVAGQMSGGELAQVTVFNPHSWRGKDWVEVEVPLRAGSGASLAAEGDGHRAPCYVIAPPANVEAAEFTGKPDGSTVRLAMLAEVPGLAGAIRFSGQPRDR